MKARQDRNDARAIIDYVAQSHTPQARCVRFGRAVAGRARNTRYEAARFALPRRDPPPLDHAGFSPAHADFKSEWPRSNRNQWPTLGIRGRFAGPTRGRHQRSRYGHGEDKRRPRAPGNHFILSSSQ
jgi:hypothetical protein